MQSSEATLVWADRVLLASSVVYLYDFFLTISDEWESIWGELWRMDPLRRRVFFISRCLPFVAVRYTALMYYSYIIYALATGTTSHCEVLSSHAQTLESIFLFTWTGAIWSRLWRLWVIYPNARLLRWVWICTLIPLGLAAPIYGVAVTNPSLFPRCRVTTHTSHAALMMPTLRVAFDGLAAAVYTAGMTRKMFEFRLFNQEKKTQASRVLMHLSAEGIQDILLIILLLIVEIVFLLIPSANSHARNLVAPFVDSFSSILAVRGPLELTQAIHKAREASDHSRPESTPEDIHFASGPRNFSTTRAEEIESRVSSTVRPPSPHPPWPESFDQSESPAILSPRPLNREETLPGGIQITRNGTDSGVSPVKTFLASRALADSSDSALQCQRPTSLPKPFSATEDVQLNQFKLDELVICTRQDMDAVKPAQKGLARDERLSRSLSRGHSEELTVSRSHTQLPRVLRPYYYSGPISRTPHTRTAGFIPPPSIHHLFRLGNELVNPAIHAGGFEDTFQPPLPDIQRQQMSSASMTQLLLPEVGSNSKSKKVKRRHSIS
ncbi:hypothetical protein C8J56DRAFT_912025 [Mycena floridula]|nr:hypothetical protein C8J56DRAFT_912025 [Mycena floridula]